MHQNPPHALVCACPHSRTHTQKKSKVSFLRWPQSLSASTSRRDNLQIKSVSDRQRLFAAAAAAAAWGLEVCARACARVRLTKGRRGRAGARGGGGCTSGLLLGHPPLLIDLSFYYHPGECHKVKDTRARRALKRGVSMCACSFTRKTHRRHSLHLHPFTCILLSEGELEFP